MPVPENAQPRDQRFVQALRGVEVGGDGETQMVFVSLTTQPDGRGMATIALSR